MKPISTPVVSTAGVAPASALQGLPFLRLGFRPFYLGAAFVTGIATVGDRMLIMMDIESLLSSAEMGLVAQVAQ